jgi:MFS family permease
MTTPRTTPDPRPPWAALPVVLAGIVMVVLDFFIVNVAMPALQADLGAGPAALEWIVAGYSLTAGVWLVSSGRLGDRCGRRRMYLLGLALFTVASAACGLAPDAGTLVAARLAQGAAAALLTPQVLAIIGVAFTGAARAKAIAAYGLAMGVAAVGGQLVGGALVQWDVAGLGWRSCFLINVPVGSPRWRRRAWCPSRGRPAGSGST